MLQWTQHAKQENLFIADSPAYHYRLLEYRNGDDRAELDIRHQGDPMSVTPIKRFVYRNPNGARGGAQRFEEKHGYRYSTRTTDKIAPFLPPLTRALCDLKDAVERPLKAASLSARVMGTDEAYARLSAREKEHREFCASVLCCTMIGCYARTEINEDRCATHRLDEGEEN